MNVKRLVSALLVCALLMASGIHSARAGQKDAQDPNRYYAPIGVMPFRLAYRYWVYDWYATSELLTEQVNDRLADTGMDVVVRESLDALGIDKERYLKQSGAEEQAMGVQFGQAQGARFMLSGRIDEAEPRVINFAGLKHVEVKVRVTAHLIDVEKGTLVPGCSFEVEGKKSRTGLSLLDGNVLNNLFDLNGSAHRLYVDACKDAAGKLVKLVIAKYPQVPVTRPFFASWSDEISAPTEKDACLQMLHRVTEALTDPATRTANADLLKTEIDDEYERFTEAEKVRDGRYKVSVYLSKPTGAGMEKALALPKRLQEKHCLRQLKVIVSVPETHIAATRLPDPAGETKLREELQEMGFVIVDFDRAKELRDQVTDRLADNPHLDDALLRSIQQQYPADILVWGEAISQAAEVRRNGTGQVSCNARVEVRAIWMKDGRVLGQGSAHAGGIETSEAVAAKKALLNAGGLVAPHLGQNMICNAYLLPQTPSPTGGTPKVPDTAPGTAGTLTLVVTGCDSALYKQIYKALQAVPGITNVERMFKDNTATFTLQGDTKTLKHFSDRLDDNDSLKKCNLDVVSEEPDTVTWRVKSR